MKSGKKAKTRASNQSPHKRRLLLIASLVVVMLLGAGTYICNNSQAAALVVSGIFSGKASLPLMSVLSDVPLRDTTVMQSFVYDSSSRSWIFAQVMGSGRFGLSGAQQSQAGNMTLTKVSPQGKILGYMYLQGFGHGVSMGNERVGGRQYLWTEVGSAVDGFGTKIARFEWKDGATTTPTSTGVSLYDPNPGMLKLTPYVDAANNLMAIHYYDPVLSTYKWATYSLDAFKNRDYTATRRVDQPALLTDGIVRQGWAISNTGVIYNLSGTAYGATNPLPGNTVLSELDLNGTVLKQTPVVAQLNMVYREPEGATLVRGDNLCIGFASGEVGARRANVLCRKFVF